MTACSTSHLALPGNIPDVTDLAAVRARYLKPLGVVQLPPCGPVVPRNLFRIASPPHSSRSPTPPQSDTSPLISCVGAGVESLCSRSSLENFGEVSMMAFEVQYNSDPILVNDLVSGMRDAGLAHCVNPVRARQLLELRARGQGPETFLTVAFDRRPLDSRGHPQVSVNWFFVPLPGVTGLLSLQLPNRFGWHVDVHSFDSGRLHPGDVLFVRISNNPEDQPVSRKG